MKLWNAVEKTNPAHTKKVNQRGGFTAIDAHYQVMQATEAFGAVGIGWGYECEYQFPDKTVVCLLTFWHGDRSNTYGPIAGCAKFTDGRLDPDAPKKAMTDALTKALSHLGFNADVFLGKFDDNKYIEQVTKDFAPKPMTKEAAVASLAAAANLQALVNAWNAIPTNLKENQDVLGIKDARKAELSPTK